VRAKRRIALIYCGVTATGTGGFIHLEVSLASSVCTGGHCLMGMLPAPPLVSVAWIWDVEVTSYVYIFALDYAKAPRWTNLVAGTGVGPSC
jgi:hypothetical protein